MGFFPGADGFHQIQVAQVVLGHRPGPTADDHPLRQGRQLLHQGLTERDSEGHGDSLAAQGLGTLKPLDAKKVEGSFDSPIKVSLDFPDGDTKPCPLFVGRYIKGVKNGPSPEWLQRQLRAIGLRPISTLVDITNYILHDLGQPLHAFDAAKIGEGKIRVGKLPKGSTFVTLDGKERKLSGEELMICDPKGGMCIAGVFGGAVSGVSEQTTSIFLESAYFSPDVIRKGSQVHGLKTDASFRFERGTDPNMPVYALKQAVILLQRYAGAKVASEITDSYPEPKQDVRIPVNFGHINRLIGKVIEPTEVVTILESLEIAVSELTGEGFVATVKPYRVDVTREADIIEEVLRIHGFQQVLLSEALRTDYLAEHPVKDVAKLQYRLTELLANQGYFELVTNSLTSPKYVEKAGFLDASTTVEIYNKLSEDLGVMRQTLLFSGLEVVAHNINRRQTDLKCFEFGTVYQKKAEGGYKESRRLAIFQSGNRSSESWVEPAKPFAFTDLYATVTRILERLNVEVSEVEVMETAPFAYGLSLKLGEKVLATLGLVEEKQLKLAEVRQEVWYAELDWDLLAKKSSGLKKFQELSKFPEVRRDLSLVLDKEVSFARVKVVAEKAGGKLLKRLEVFDVYQGDKLEAGKKAYALSFILQDQENTLTDKEIDKTMSNLIHAFQDQVGAIIRS